MSKHNYEVCVIKRSYMIEYLEVAASSEEEARDIALEEAENIEFLGDEYVDEYEIDSIMRVDD